MILGEEDSAVSTPTCLRRAGALRASGAAVTIEVLPGADYAFDQQERSPVSPLDFDAGPARPGSRGRLHMAGRSAALTDLDQEQVWRAQKPLAGTNGQALSPRLKQVNSTKPGAAPSRRHRLKRS